MKTIKIVKIKRQLSKRIELVKKRITVLRFEFALKFFGRKQYASVRWSEYFARRKGFYGTLVYFFFAAIIASFSQLWFTVLEPAAVFEFYVAAGAMSGGMLAIIFTFNTLLVNFAITQYPPQFFRLSGYDKRQDRIYFSLVLITISLFILGFIYRSQPEWSYLVNLIGILLLFVVFYIIYLSYSLTRQRLNPVESLSYITRPAINLLDRCDKYAKKLAGILLKDPKLTPDKLYFANYQPQLLLQKHYNDFNEFVGYLYDYHDKLVDKRDYSEARRVLDAIRVLIVRYITVRKDSFIMLPSEYLLVPVTDAQDFFDTNFQRMVQRAKVYIKLDNQPGSRQVISLFHSTGLMLKELEFPNMRHENPPLTQCIQYLGSIAEEAIKEDNIDAAFDCINTYAVLAVPVTEKHYQHTLAFVYEQLLKLTLYGVIKKHSVLVDQVAKAFEVIGAALLRQPSAAFGTHLSIYFDNLKQFYSYYCAGSAPSMDYEATRAENLLRPLKVVTNEMQRLAASASKLGNSDRNSEQRQVIELGEKLRRMLRALSDTKSVSLANRYMGTQFASIIEDAYFILVRSAHKHGWQRNKDAALNNAMGLIRQVSWFTSNAPDKIENNNLLDELSKKASNMALYGLHKGSAELANAGISINHHLATFCLQRATKSAEYDAPRIMVNACLIGVYGLKLQKWEVVRECRVKAQEFSTAYAAKLFPGGLKLSRGVHYLGTYPEQLAREFKRTADNFDNLRDGLAYDMLELPERYLKKIAPEITEDDFHTLAKYLKRSSK